MENIILNNASETMNEDLSEAEGEILDPGIERISPYVHRENWVKRNLTKILCGIIVILGLCLLGTIDSLTKTEQQLQQKTESLTWLAFQHKDVRDARDFYAKLTKDYNYYKFVKTIYEHKDSDFFETITIAYEESIKQNTDPWDTMSIMWAESGFQQYIVSQITKIDENGQPKKQPCAYGLMQINYKYWKDEKDLTLSNIYDKRTNIRVGLEIYNYYLRLANGDKKLALFYYNNGTDPITPNYRYAPTVMASKFMKMAVNYSPVDVEAKPSSGITQ